MNTGEDGRGVALFDLDGTLLAWDTQVLFCGMVLRRQPWRGVFLIPWLLATPLAPVLGVGRLKRLFLAYLWRLTQARLDQLANEFASRWFPAACFPEVLAEITRHRAARRRLVLASASPAWWVDAIGRTLGFDVALGTEVRRSAAGSPFFPPLANHKGAAKPQRLRALGIAPPTGTIPNSHGYSDSIADLPMLELCSTVTVVNPDRPLARAAARNGWQVLRPPRPWRGPVGKAAATLMALAGHPRIPHR